MPEMYVTLTGKIDRRSPQNGGDPNSPVKRENLLSRNGRNKNVPGHTVAVSALGGIPTWSGRYYTIETGITQPKTFIYTQDGRLWVLDHLGTTATEVASGLALNVYPKHWTVKKATISYMYLVDGENLWVYDGNNDNKWRNVGVVDADGKPVNPIDVIEHRDRLCLISKTNLYISANLQFETFNDAMDSLDVIVGSSKGDNLSFGKIKDNDALYVLNTEGIFGLAGDTISAVANTFSVIPVDDRRIIAARSAVDVESAIIFLADDLELYSFNGNGTTIMSFREKLKDFINPHRIYLDKITATYEDNYYKMSFVETGETNNNLEVWWDAFEDKIDFVRGRNVGCYLKLDSTKERQELRPMFGRSDAESMMWDNVGVNFNGIAPKIALRSRDLTPVKGANVRFTAFRPEIVSTGERNMFFRYLLDGRLSDLDHAANFIQDLSGEAKVLGFIRIKNQEQFMDRIRPKINYSKGMSVAFEIIDETVDMEFEMLGIGIDYVGRAKKKSKRVGA